MTNRPAPVAVSDVPGFTDALRLLKVWAGNPSFDQLARRSGLSRSALADAVKPGRRQAPRLDVVRGFVSACGVSEPTEWVDAWRRVQSATPVHRVATVPRELPPDVGAFVGRTSAVEGLDTVLEAADTRKIVIVCGTAGVGKTALALHWSHRVADEFPDGQMYLNLRGHDAEQPIEVADAAGTLLRSLLPPGATLPADEQARISLYRGFTSERRLLIVLDDASSAAQVRPLLPAGTGCLVLITSRDSLAGLVARDGARRIALDVLSPSESRGLLARFVGERAHAEPAAIAELARSCAYLPLGLRVAAELAASRPHVALADLLADLDATETLDQLNAGRDEQRSLRSVFSWSYLKLPADAARAFRLLAAHPGRDYDVYAVAALCGVPLPTARRLTRVLQRAHLIERLTAERFTMHDLLHAYAVELAANDPSAQRARSRLVDLYVWCVTSIHRLLHPYDARPLADLAEQPPAPAPDLSVPDRALAWFAAERVNLVAAVGADVAPEQVIALANALDRQLNHGAHYSDDATVLRAALDAARTIGDRVAEGKALCDLGRVYGQTGRYDEALGHFAAARAVSETLGDRATLQAVLIGSGCVYYDLGQCSYAAQLYSEALARAADTGSVWWQALALGHLGLCEGRAGQYEAALHTYNQAVYKYREAGSLRGESSVLESIGSTYRQLDQPMAAILYFTRAAEAARRARSVAHEIGAWNGLGDVLRSVQRFDESARRHEDALRLARQIGDRLEAVRALDGLGELALARHDYSEARAHWDEAHRLSLEIGIPSGELRTKLARLAEAERPPCAG